MDIFYIIVLSIAAVLLILNLTYVGIIMNKASISKGNFPPLKSTCPDYWTVSTSTLKNGTKTAVCKIPTSGPNVPSTTGANNYTTGNNTPGYISADKTINFSDDSWSAKGSSLCTQSFWANQYNIAWDGVSNTNSC